MESRLLALGLMLLGVFVTGLAQDPPRLELRTRVQAFKGSDQWQEAYIQRTVVPGKTAIVICDMWDKHWCRGATDRVNAMVGRMHTVLQAARRKGVTIVHAPSDTMDFYQEHPARMAILGFPPASPERILEITDPPLPIDDSDEGCDTPGDQPHRAWTSQHAGITIEDGDLISDNGREVYSMLKAKGIDTLLVMGVHTNMCILNRSFAIRQMSRWGVDCILVRDLTDAMYNPQSRPYVSHDEGTQLVIQHIEQYWAPTVLSDQLLAAFSSPDRQ
jgi:nicotinamidase-related amidase